MRTPPPGVTDSWPDPNFENPAIQGRALLVTQVILVPLALTALAARLFVRVKIVRKWGWDDILMIVAWPFSLGVSITVILATQTCGWCRHVWDLTGAQLVESRKASISAQTLFLFSSSSVKLSILWSYLRIAIRGTLFRHLTWAGILWLVLTFITFFIVLWTRCF